jgi:hypothetical protein
LCPVNPANDMTAPTASTPTPIPKANLRGGEREGRERGGEGREREGRERGERGERGGERGERERGERMTL